MKKKHLGKMRKVLAYLLSAALFLGSVETSVYAMETGEEERVPNVSGGDVVENVEETAEPEKIEIAMDSVSANDLLVLSTVSGNDLLYLKPFEQSVEVGGGVVSVMADQGVLPVNAVLSVREVTASEAAEVLDAVDKVRVEEQNVAVSYTFDIKVYSAEGEEIQPDPEKGAVRVSFAMTEVSNENLESWVYHVAEAEDGLLAESLATQTVAAEEGIAEDADVEMDANEAVVAQTQGFSYYTVEFTYGTRQYVLQGDERVNLVDILEAVGITVNGEITDVAVSNEELFAAIREDDVWSVAAKQPFYTEEWLKFTMDGVEYGIVVTDAVSIDYTQPRSYTDSMGNVYLGGYYMEIGISKYGSFGTSKAPDSAWGFHCEKNAPDTAWLSGGSNFGQLGLLIDEDGWGNGNVPTSGDFFVPGTPEERWIFAYYLDGVKHQYIVADRMNVIPSDWAVNPQAVDTSHGDTLSCTVTGVTDMGVQVSFTYSFGVYDKQYNTSLRVVNNSGKSISEVRFVRSFDPDQDQWTQGTYKTYNKVICNPDPAKPAGDTNYCLVVARGEKTLNAFFFLIFDNRVRASHGGSVGGVGSAYQTELWDTAPVTGKNYAEESDLAMTATDLNGYTLDDKTISVTFDYGTMASGTSVTSDFYSSLDPDLLSSINKIKQAQKGKYEVTSSTVTAKELDTDFSYRLVDPDSNVLSLAGEVLGDMSDTTIGWQTGESMTWRNLRDDTPYLHQALEIGNADAQVQDVHTVTTAINPVDSTLDGEGQEVLPDWTVYPESMRFTHLDPQYEYALLAADGKTVVKDYVAAPEGTVIYAGLESETAYYLVARSSSNPLSDQVEFVTTGLVVTGIEDMIYTGNAVVQNDLSVTLQTREAAESGIQETVLAAEEYTAAYANNTNVGTASISVTVTRDGVQVASFEGTFQIQPRELEILWGSTEFVYDGSAHIPAVTVNGIADGDAGVIEVSGEQVNASDIPYIAMITFSGNPNYTVAAEDLTKNFTISPIEIEVEWGNRQFVYNGLSQKPIAVAKGVLDGEEVTIAVTGEQTDANEPGESYTAVAAFLGGANASNYALPKDPELVSTSFVIGKMNQSKPELTGNDETILGKKDGTITGLTRYSGGGNPYMEYAPVDAEGNAATYEKVTDATMILAAGTYRVRYAESKNYQVSEAADVVIGPGRKLTVTIPGQNDQIGYLLTADRTELAWHEDAVLTFVLKAGYTPEENFAVMVNGGAVSLTWEGTDANGDTTYQYTIAQAETDSVVTVAGVADVTKPEAEIQVSAYTWQSFFNKITFGIFFKEMQRVTITASDAGSGVESIGYYVSAVQLDEEVVQSMEETDWTVYRDAFMIDRNAKYVIYAKVTDRAGNVLYLSSDGMVIDTIPPVIGGVVDGWVYTKDVLFTVTDTYPESVKVDGRDGTEEDGTYSISADGKRHVITATDKAGNLTSVMISAGPVEIAPIADQAYTGSEIEPALTVTCCGSVLRAGVDYEATYSSNVELSTAESPAGVRIALKGNYIGADVETSFRIVPKEILITPVVAQKVYGEADPELTYVAEGLADGEALTGNIGRSSGEDAGEYAYNLGNLANAHYTLTLYNPDQAVFRITEKEQQAPKLTAAAETVWGKADGRIQGLDVGMEYRKAEGNLAVLSAFVPASQTDLTFAAGTYQVRYAAKKNYTVSDVAEVVIEPGRRLQVELPRKAEQIGYTMTVDEAVTARGGLAWHESATVTFVLHRGYSMVTGEAEDNFAVRLNGTAVSLTDAGTDDNGGRIYTFAIDRAEMDSIITVEGVADITPPTGRITLSDTEAKGIWSNAAEELRNVKITGEDTGSGLDRILYYRTTGMLTDTALRLLGEEAWKPYNRDFDIPVNGGYTVYAKLIDGAGNATYLSAAPKSLRECIATLDREVFDHQEGVSHAPQVIVTDQEIWLAQEEYELAGTPEAEKMGTYSIAVTGKGKYYGTVNLTWKIVDTAKTQTDGRGEIAEGTGKIVTYIVLEEDVPLVQTEDLTADLAANVLTADEQAVTEKARKAGQDYVVNLYLNISSIDTSVQASERAEVAKLAAQGATGVTYFDITLFKQIIIDGETQGISTVHEVDMPIEIVMNAPDLPERYSEYTRSFKVVRVHDGQAELLDTVQDESGTTLSFATDRFSTYALVYTDKDTEEREDPVEPGRQPASPTDENAPVKKSPKTGEEYLPDEKTWLILLLMGALGAAVLRRRMERRRRGNSH